MHWVWRYSDKYKHIYLCVDQYMYGISSQPLLRENCLSWSDWGLQLMRLPLPADFLVGAFCGMFLCSCTSAGRRGCGIKLEGCLAALWREYHNWQRVESAERVRGYQTQMFMWKHNNDKETQWKHSNNSSNSSSSRGIFSPKTQVVLLLEQHTQ